ncbi:MAG: class I SAM-dependent RNA methyltransferase [Verrucomicrobia bacterium]|nr:class I SAM-dependent RNA methyltransferase [Verrucomicrobiota bacterium]
MARHDGQVIFVRFTAPGEKIRAVLTERHKTFARAELLEVLEPSPDRIAPPCPLFGRCGGCATQHIAYPAETRIKAAQIESALRRIGKVADPVIRPILTGPDYGYRNRITIHNREGKMGFLETDGRTLVDVPRCLLAADDVNEKLAHLRSRPRPRPHYSVRADEVRGEAFYQSNRPLAGPLKKLILEAVPAQAKTVLEGYAGTGFFSSPLAAAGKRVIAIESHPAAVEVFRKEAGKAELVEGRFEDEFENVLARLGAGPAVCLINPPRGGLSPDARKLLAQPRPFLGILYLSCDPPALARDVAALGASWKPEWFQPVDLFPRTAHVECLAWLSSRLSPDGSRAAGTGR